MPTTRFTRPFLKWPGNKFRCLHHIIEHLPKGHKLVEPFLGSGAVFLNTNYDSYQLNDVNPDLILTYNTLKEEGCYFIDYCQSFFTTHNNTKEQFYKLRTLFNETHNKHKRAALFLYLNRHCYNGLVRYNQAKGEFNSPFGQYDRPYFPKKEMLIFYHKAKHARFYAKDFTDSLKYLKKGTVVYCDPPYVPLSNTANFTQYAQGAFGFNEQETLLTHALKLRTRGIRVLISNHNTQLTQTLYASARIMHFSVSRSISCQPHNRMPAKELLAIF